MRRSRFSSALVIAGLALAILVWALWPHDEAGEVARESPPRLAGAAKGRALPRPMRRVRPDGPHAPGRAIERGDSEDSTVQAEQTPAAEDREAMKVGRLSRAERS